MKFMHISDLHLGKTLQGFSIYEDQKHILKELARMAQEEEAEGILIAGDIYDRAVPSGEAMGLFDRFLTDLVALPKKPHIFVIYGNHDGVERLIYGRELLENVNIHFCPVYRGEVKPICIQDEFGPIHVYLLPFLHPFHVEDYAEGEKFDTYEKAISYVIGQIPLDEEARNILVTHQFFSADGKAERSDSESNIRGGTEEINVSVVSHFDYVALGHLHKPQYVGGYHVRYCGSPLKYSLSEATNEKTATFVELREKGESLERKNIPLLPLRDLVVVKGTLDEITQKEREEKKYQDCYVYVILTDEERESSATEILRRFFPYLVKHEYEKGLNLDILELGTLDKRDIKDPFMVCKEFFGKQMALQQLSESKQDPEETEAEEESEEQTEVESGEEADASMAGLNEKQSAYLKALIERVWGNEE